ncbi:MAG: hypothetical protein MI975_01920 [Cytophagales bacterium]|nr:hypothetical protein [Cytophagales bacterium]
MKRVFYIICVIASCYFSACQQKMICPAYHSYFILDVEETRKTFTLFGPDSLPKDDWEVDKEKYGIAREVPDRKKNREMQIISMNSIYNKIEDPFEIFRREYTASDTSVYVDSAAVIAQSRGLNDFQNIDQMIYLHHFGKYLPRRGGGIDDEIKEDLKQEEPMVTGESEEEKPKKKRKLWPFGKKNKAPQEEEQTEEEAGQ